MKSFYLWFVICLAAALLAFFFGDFGSAMVCALLMIAPILEAFDK